MAMDRFVEALKKTPRIEYEGADRIPGTDKVRTYAAAQDFFSKESNLQTIIANEQRAFPKSEQ